MRIKRIFFYLLCVTTILILMYVLWTPEFMSLFIKCLLRRTPIEKEGNMKYVLLWTSDREPMNYMGTGQETFIKSSCSCTTCFVTYDRYYLSDVTQFEVIIFHTPELYWKNNLIQMPEARIASQNYIFTSMESSAYYPVDKRLNNYFNYTMTYKLYSDIYYGYIAIKNNKGEVIGPRTDMNWMNVDDMSPINDTLKLRLANKKIAAAWFVSNCNSPSKRELLALRIKRKMETYNMTLDIYGKCGDKSCPVGSMEQCLELIQKDYYFYFSFENSFADDYVTEKLLHALQNYAIPIVYGGANYTRFMPDGIYLDALQLSVEQLVSKMYELISNRSSYYEYFKWHKHYSYHGIDGLDQSADINSYCVFCDYINNKISVNDSHIITNLDEWWNT